MLIRKAISVFLILGFVAPASVYGSEAGDHLRAAGASLVKAVKGALGKGGSDPGTAVAKAGPSAVAINSIVVPLNPEERERVVSQLAGAIEDLRRRQGEFEEVKKLALRVHSFFKTSHLSYDPPKEAAQISMIMNRSHSSLQATKAGILHQLIEAVNCTRCGNAGAPVDEPTLIFANILVTDYFKSLYRVETILEAMLTSLRNTREGERQKGYTADYNNSEYAIAKLEEATSDIRLQKAYIERTAKAHGLSHQLKDAVLDLWAFRGAEGGIRPLIQGVGFALQGLERLEQSQAEFMADQSRARAEALKLNGGSMGGSNIRVVVSRPTRALSRGEASPAATTVIPLGFLAQNPDGVIEMVESGGTHVPAGLTQVTGGRGERLLLPANFTTDGSLITVVGAPAPSSPRDSRAIPGGAQRQLSPGQPPSRDARSGGGGRRTPIQLGAGAVPATPSAPAPKPGQPAATPASAQANAPTAPKPAEAAPKSRIPEWMKGPRMVYGGIGTLAVAGAVGTGVYLETRHKKTGEQSGATPKTEEKRRSRGR